jgi:VWFA-related protein
VRPPAAIALGVAFAAVAAGLTLAAQAQPPQPTFRTEANYVRVDVYPTRDGAPVADLTAADFEIVEDKVPQKVEQFEHIVIRSAGAQQGRPEPSTVAESLAAVQDPRARVFVLFLDRMHVELGASRQIGRPMIDTLNQLIGPDDYVATMMTGMSARDITFARRTTSIEDVLKHDWWGGRDRMILDDPVENQYALCYPGIPTGGQGTASDQGIAQQMILRRREQQTLDALEDLVVFLRGVREERKAVLAITDGWLLYKPDSNLIRPIDNAPPTIPVIGVDPRSGRLTTKNTQNPGAPDNQACERDRLALSQIDDEPRFRTIMDEANRANASFYPIDPRGLVVFDNDIVPAAGVGFGPNANPTVPPVQDQGQLTARVTSLRRLAEGTDGTAVVATNNIFPALRRITDDLSSYYLLGYYSSGKLDGRFHAITVRVKRPGVSVRARRGYQAPRLADLARAALPPPTAAAPSADMAIAVAAASAVGHIAGSVRDLPLRVHVTAGWRAGADGRPVAAFWTVGEVVDRMPGSDLEAVLTTGAGEIVTSARGRIMPGTTSALVAVVPGQSLAPGEYAIRLRSQGPGGTETLSMPVTLPPASQSSGAVFIRRGPGTGNKEMATADLRFRRSERLRVEVPSPADAIGARLLDRTGKPLAVPVVAATRTDADGTRWATGELALAPLGAGDYVIEVLAGDMRTLVAFRIIL